MGNCLFLRRGAPPSSGPQLGDLEPGTLISLEENGAQVPYVLQGTRLTLTNEPEQPPQPYVPTTEQRLSAVEYQLNSMEQAIAEGVSSVE